MACFVVGRFLEFIFSSECILLFASHGLFVNCKFNICLLRLLLGFEDGVYECLVNDIGNVSATHACGLAGQQVHLVEGRSLKRALAHLVFKQILPAVLVRQVDLESPVKPPGAQECLIECIQQIGGPNHDDIVIFAEPVHLREHLV